MRRHALRRLLRRLTKRLAATAALSLFLSGPAWPDEYNPYRLLTPAGEGTDVRFQTASMLQEEPSPFQPPQATLLGLQSTVPIDFAEQQDEAAAVPGPTQLQDVSTSTLTQNTDVVGALSSSEYTPSVGSQRRSPVALDPYVRGYRGGQLYTVADDAFWLPLRQDLDTVLNKVDPSSVDSMVVIPGPYGLRHGPGFAFIDILTFDTPRPQNGFEAHARSGFSTRTNGGQIFGRQMVEGGNADYGFRINYGIRTGSDYEAGNGQRIPSSYQSQTFVGQFGISLDDERKLEFRYNRLDGTDTEYANQIFDIDFVVSDAFILSYIDDSPASDSYTRGDVWYNRSRFVGTTALGPPPTGKRAPYNILPRIESAIDAELGNPNGTTFIQDDSNTQGDAISSGARAFTTYGDRLWYSLSLGADVRYIEQHVSESIFVVTNTGAPQSFSPIQTNMPRAEMVDPGLFIEATIPMLPYWNVAVGGRVDWVHMAADKNDFAYPNDPTDTNFDVDERERLFDQSDLLHAFYVTNRVELTDNWTTNLDFGYAERPPTLLERYSDGVFLGLIQSGFSRMIGRPNLRRERNWQVDWGVSADYENVRGTATVFHSWILDYVTFEANSITQPGSARLLQTINTDVATLAGFEAYGEMDATETIALFGVMRYVDGRDRIIDAPLPAILPFESRVGFRLRDPAREVWGFESGIRMVNGQDRLAALRITGTDQIEQLEFATPGFTTTYIQGYYNFNNGLNLVAGVDNLFDRNYLEHVDLRLPAETINGQNFAATQVLSPGITPYIGMEWYR